MRSSKQSGKHIRADNYAPHSKMPAGSVSMWRSLWGAPLAFHVSADFGHKPWQRLAPYTLLVHLHVVDRQLPVEDGVEGDDSLAAREAERLQLVVDDVEQVVVVDGEYLYE